MNGKLLLYGLNFVIRSKILSYTNISVARYEISNIEQKVYFFFNKRSKFRIQVGRIITILLSAVGAFTVLIFTEQHYNIKTVQVRQNIYVI